MSNNDGRFAESTYLTSDICVAAYLLMRGFTLLGAADNGSVRKEFGLLQPVGVPDLQAYVYECLDEFTENGYRDFYNNLKELRRSLDRPVVRHS